MRALQIRGVRVLNGADAFTLELSKTTQAVLLKPEQGGSGARIMLVESFAHLEALSRSIPSTGCRTTCCSCRSTFPRTPPRAQDGRLMFYGINANSNPRPSIAQAFGFDPFERVVDFLVREIKRGATAAPRVGKAAGITAQ